MSQQKDVDEINQLLSQVRSTMHATCGTANGLISDTPPVISYLTSITTVFSGFIITFKNIITFYTSLYMKPFLFSIHQINIITFYLTTIT